MADETSLAPPAHDVVNEDRVVTFVDAGHGFALNARGAQAVGRPTLEQFAGALRFARAAANASPYWIGDLMRYADTRTDYKERLSQVVEFTGLEVGTVQNVTSICKRVPEHVRDIAPSIGHAAVTAALPVPDQEEWQERATTEGWGVRELALNVKAASRRKVISGQAELKGRYRVIYADPPWSYRDRPPSGKGAKEHYPTMTVEELCALPIAAHTQQHAVLWLWVTSPMLEVAFQVIRAWGFDYKASMVWDKVLHNFGHYVSIRHELILIATRGSCTPDRPTPMPDSVFTERREEVHSRKPSAIRKVIERLYDGPYLELFGRARVEGWTVFGNDATLWNEPVTSPATRR